MNTLADLLATALHNAFVFQKLQQQSITDGLTGIKTRRFFWEALSSEWKRASRSGRPFSVVLIDLDKFKEVNDTLGHLEGDWCWRGWAGCWSRSAGNRTWWRATAATNSSFSCRKPAWSRPRSWPNACGCGSAQDPMLHEHHITGSFGVASFPVHGFSVEDIIRVADAGMYVSKHAGRRSGFHRRRILGRTKPRAVQRQLISGYIEGFLQREHTGPEHLEELLTTLKKLCGEEKTTPTRFCGRPLRR